MTTTDTAMPTLIDEYFTCALCERKEPAPEGLQDAYAYIRDNGLTTALVCNDCSLKGNPDDALATRHRPGRYETWLTPGATRSLLEKVEEYLASGATEYYPDLYSWLRRDASR